MAGSWEDGRIKLAVTVAGLRARRTYPELFGTGDYVPLHVAGPRADHVVAFARRTADRWAAAAVPRRTLGLAGGSLWPRDGWEETRIELPEDAPAAWTEELTRTRVDADGAIDAGVLFAKTPVALLISMHEDGTET